MSDSPDGYALPTQVYVVTSGCYSDYGISSIWLTREEAEIAAGPDPDDGYGSRVEVWPIGDNERTLGSFSHTADLDPVTGEVVQEWSADGPDITKGRADVCWQPRAGHLYIRVDQETRERADKVFSEVKAQVRASIDLGLPPRAIATTEYAGGTWRPIDPATVTADRGSVDPKEQT